MHSLGISVFLFLFRGNSFSVFHGNFFNFLLFFPLFSFLGNSSASAAHPVDLIFSSVSSLQSSVTT